MLSALKTSVSQIGRSHSGCFRTRFISSGQNKSSAMSTILNNEISNKQIEVQWNDGTKNQYLATWLRDHDPVSVHPESFQRQSNTLEMVTSNPRPSEPIKTWVENNTKSDSETLMIEWAAPLILSGGIKTPTITSFSKEWLNLNHVENNKESSTKINHKNLSSFIEVGSPSTHNTIPQLWGANGYAPINTDSIFKNSVSCEYFMKDDEGLKDVLGRLRRDGFAIIKNCPLNSEGTGQVIARIGMIRRTMYSDGVWDTAIRPPSQDEEGDGDPIEIAKTKMENQYTTTVVDTAYTNMELLPHTDCTYYRDPPALQIFNCVERAPIGGATWIVDGFAIAAKMKRDCPESYQFFISQPIPFHCIESTTHVEAIDYVFKLNHNEDKIIQYRYNNDDRAPLKPEIFQNNSKMKLKNHYPRDVHEKFIKFYETYLPNLLSISQEKTMACELKLKEGDMLIVNNHRVLHGRRFFEGPRNMIGAYIGLDEYESACRLLNLPHDIGASI